ncbi:MAG: Crossover junction endodeoxyribonuclease RuvC [candidate division TM6 bacterium GW2011_GWF2_30_66]|jgi:crossover junction endodeoxyribonuclease RuvC|nr:MAG: Crossover junction endodeoxyribonuclease RuvC [candidate division TM6 bacterium GW2011_GWF2_30_66]
MVILGIDPGTRFAGFGILQKEKQKVFLLDYGCLSMSPAKSLPERVEIFYNFFSEKIIKYGVTELALETPFLGKSAGNFLKLGYMRGILYLLASKNKLTLHEFAPREIKLTVTGFGGASKEQVASVVLRLLPGLLSIQKDDVTDALAISLCGLWQSKFSRLTLDSK